MFAKIEAGAVAQFPYTLTDMIRANPSTSFPAQISDETAAEFGVVRVHSVDAPTYDPGTQELEQGTPVFDAESQRWVQTWTVRNLTQNELDQLHNQGILSQILQLESTVTDRRYREAVLGTDGGWLAELNRQIVVLRAQLR